MNKNFGLGRGLSSLIPQANTQTNNDSYKQESSQAPENGEASLKDSERVFYLSPDEIEANPFQPRKEFNRHELDDLVNSIKEHGIIQPLVLTKLKEVIN